MLIVRGVSIRETDYLYRDLILFTVFLCYALNEKLLAEYFELCFNDEKLIRDFYDTKSILNDEEKRKQIVSYLKPFGKLPFNLRV
jgi:hypothetical protein